MKKKLCGRIPPMKFPAAFSPPPTSPSALHRALGGSSPARSGFAEDVTAGDAGKRGGFELLFFQPNYFIKVF